MKKLIFLFFIIFLEGYVVLSAELLAIRQIIPFVGSGTDTVSIIIAAVLMPLAVGYYFGGQYKERTKNKPAATVRKKLLSNIFIANIFFFFGLSYYFLGLFFETLGAQGITHRLALTTIYSLVFLVIPVFLLAQTIPLVSHYFSKEKLSEITGKMLFFSTVGSFMGAVFSTLVLMSYLGVHHTTSITLGCLTVLYIMLSRKIFTERAAIMVAIFVASLFVNSNAAMTHLGIVENNKYNTIRVVERNEGHTRLLMLNNNRSSLYTEPTLPPDMEIRGLTSFLYSTFIEQHLMPDIDLSDDVHEILVIGAGGFTIGMYNEKDNITYVDIDDSLKEVTEKYFLKQKLNPNQKFAPVPARAFINNALQNDKKFDLIILDTYLGKLTFPEHLATQEFFGSLREILKDDGILAANFIVSASFSNKFSQKIDNTFRSVFPHVTRQVIGNYNFWNRDPNKGNNVIYVFTNRKNDDLDVYTDNLNQVVYDKDEPAE